MNDQDRGEAMNGQELCALAALSATDAHRSVIPVEDFSHREGSEAVFKLARGR